MSIPAAGDPGPPFFAVEGPLIKTSFFGTSQDSIPRAVSADGKFKKGDCYNPS